MYPIPVNSSNKNLMIFDDLLLEKQNKCESYYIRGRHSNVDCFYLSQNYFKLPRQTIRENANFICLFPQDSKNINHIYNDHVSQDMSKEQFRSLCKKAWEDFHGFVVIDLSSKRTTESTGKISTSFISYKKYRVHTKMEELLAKICKNTEPKGSRQIVVSSNKTRFNTRFNPPMQLDKNKKYEMALVNLETYYSFPNIDASNNYFRYSHDGGTTWVDIFIPEGSYDIVDINDTIQQKMRQNGHYDRVNEDYYITISANANTLKAVMILDNNYQVDFRQTHSVSGVLGFNNVIYITNYQESENVVNILSVNSLYVNTDIIAGSYVNGSQRNTIYSFFPNVSPGYKIVETPVNLVYLPVVLDTIHSLEVSLTDQHDNLLNLRGEHITMRFHIREV